MRATSVRTKYELIAVLALIVLALGGGGWYLHWSRLPLDPYSAPDADGYDAQSGAPLPPVEGHAQATLVEEQDDGYVERPSPASAAAQEIARSRKEEAAEAFSLLERGVKCYKRRRFPEALEALQAAVILAPEEARAWRYLSATYFELGDYEQAIASARRVVRLTPDDPVALCNLGTVLRKAGELGQARAYQLRARRLAPGYRRARVELAKLDRLERDAQDDDS
jgi:tetratricopeptide (TPR) repeat protein